jgi:hypothetical protein
LPGIGKSLLACFVSYCGADGEERDRLRLSVQSRHVRLREWNRLRISRRPCTFAKAIGNRESAATLDAPLFCHEPRGDAISQIFPGYTNLRAMSRTRSRVLQDNIGIGWTTYLRFGNIRIFYEHSRKHQERTHANLDAALARGELFVAYLSTFPNLSINHAVLVDARRRASPSTRTAAIERYIVYDPNHPEAPREITWSPTDRAFAFQKDWDFVGGFVRVYQVYGKPIQ